MTAAGGSSAHLFATWNRSWAGARRGARGGGRATFIQRVYCNCNLQQFHHVTCLNKQFFPLWPIVSALVQLRRTRSCATAAPHTQLRHATQSDALRGSCGAVAAALTQRQNTLPLSYSAREPFDLTVRLEPFLSNGGVTLTLTLTRTRTLTLTLTLTLTHTDTRTRTRTRTLINGGVSQNKRGNVPNWPNLREIGLPCWDAVSVVN